MLLHRIKFFEPICQYTYKHFKLNDECLISLLYGCLHFQSQTFSILVAVSVVEVVFIVIGRNCSKGCGFDSHYWLGSFLRFNSRPIMSSPYCATWNKGVWLLSVLKLWPIVEMSVVSENDGITVGQAVAHTIQLWPRGLGTPCGSRLLRRKA